MSRGRPSEQPARSIRKMGITQTCYEVPSKPELGWTSIWHYDQN